MSEPVHQSSDVERAKALRLAKMFDLRTFIGSLFVIFGVVVTLLGITASAEEIAKASDINISLWSGLVMLATGLGFIAWMLRQPPVLPDEGSKLDRPDAEGQH